MKEISHPKKPDWFSHDKYDGLHELTVIDLYKMINLRGELENIARLKDDDIFNPFLSFFENPTNACELLDYAFTPFNSDVLIEGELFSDDDEHYINNFPSVRLSKENADKAKIGTLWGRKNNGAFDGSLKSLFIDISAPERVIREAFDEWLKVAKKEFSKSVSFLPKQSFKPVKERIIEQKLIQYLDLKIWFTLKGIAYTDFEMASILFPFEKDGEHIRKTVRPNAEALLEFYFRMWLNHQIGNENS